MGVSNASYRPELGIKDRHHRRSWWLSLLAGDQELAVHYKLVTEPVIY